MDRYLNRLGHQFLADWPVAGVSLCGVGMVWRFGRRGLQHVAERMVDRRVRKEMEAYARLEVRRPAGGDVKGLSRRVCMLVAEVSVFRVVAMLAKDAGERIAVAANVGMDEWMLEALNEWERETKELELESWSRDGVRSIAGVKAGAVKVQMEMSRVNVWLVPMWSSAGRLLGAIAVCGDGELAPLEGLAAKLARSLENAELAERLMRTERMAGLGRMAGGMAHALNNPLTAVLGFAELIAETSDQAEVREEATTIAREAVRMQETMQGLMGMWQASTAVDEDVDLSGLVEELRAECCRTLEGRGVGLVVEVAEGVPAVRGSRERLRQVLERVLNHAAEAIGDAGNGNHEIRMTLRHDACGVQMMVCDTGVGFAEPMRVFESGKDLGLSLCYGMVREHGGEISAYNLHPSGSAVVIELPVLALDRELVAAD